MKFGSTIMFALSLLLVLGLYFADIHFSFLSFDQENQLLALGLLFSGNSVDLAEINLRAARPSLPFGIGFAAQGVATRLRYGHGRSLRSPNAVGVLAAACGAARASFPKIVPHLLRKLPAFVSRRGTLR